MTYYKDRPAPPLPDVSVICPPMKKEKPVTGWQENWIALKFILLLAGVAAWVVLLLYVLRQLLAG